MEQHLTSEALARLVDETPTDDERAHLAACAECRAEMEAVRELTVSLGRLPDLRPPRGDWAVLEARMASEGLIQVESGLLGRLARTPAWMRTVAMVALFVGGMGAGMGISTPSAAGAATAGTNQSTGPYALTATTASTVEEAVEAVRLAERAYVDAMVQLRQMTSDDQTATINPEARLAALEWAIVALQAGVEDAPGDPALNGLLASAVAERQATMRQVSTATDWY